MSDDKNKNKLDSWAEFLSKLEESSALRLMGYLSAALLAVAGLASKYVEPTEKPIPEI